MSTPHKEKLIRVLQLFQTTDEKTPMNAVQVSQKLEEEYGMENVHRTSIYDDVRLLSDMQKQQLGAYMDATTEVHSALASQDYVNGVVDGIALREKVTAK